jgi:hypothetical protein
MRGKAADRLHTVGEWPISIHRKGCSKAAPGRVESHPLCKCKFQPWKLALAKGNLKVTGRKLGVANRHKLLTEAVTERGDLAVTNRITVTMNVKNNVTTKKNVWSDQGTRPVPGRT